MLSGDEDLIALRMRAHAANGDLAGVRHEWQSYERVIAADPWSDGEPAPKLVELRHQLLSPNPHQTAPIYRLSFVEYSRQGGRYHTLGVSG